MLSNPHACIGTSCCSGVAILTNIAFNGFVSCCTCIHSTLQAADSRDSTAMRIYANLFRWILEKINMRIKGGEDKFAFIGVLDIFGFENFSVNRFEQFCINFANEKLQEFFNKHIFSLEQHEYSK